MSEPANHSTPQNTLAPPIGRNAQAMYRDLKLTVAYVPITSIKAYKRALRTHTPTHIEQLQASIQAFGFVQPVLIDAEHEIIAGHGIVEAAKKLGYATVPTVCLSHLSEAEQRTLRIGLNRLAEGSGWNKELLALEFKDLIELDLSLDLTFDLAITGFASPEIDQLIQAVTEVSESTEHDDILPKERSGPAVSRLGDLWLLDEHRLICGDARQEATYAALLGGERAAMGIHDAPYDVPISGHVAKRGRHPEFVMGSGELGSAFIPFLSAFLAASSAHLAPGGYQFCFMDWRHMGEMLAAGQAAGLELKNLCVWNKGSGAMGSLYRSQHELVFVFKDPSAPGANNVQLGRYGRNRVNVWSYPGAASLRKELELHPTPKNVQMIADAVRDVTKRGEIVLDAFSGSGTTIMACAKVGRRGYAIELDPHYVDVGVRRWEEWSGRAARHAETKLTFAEMAEQRLKDSSSLLSRESDGTAEALEPNPADDAGPAPTARVCQRSPRAA